MLMSPYSGALRKQPATRRPGRGISPRGGATAAGGCGGCRRCGGSRSCGGSARGFPGVDLVFGLFGFGGSCETNKLNSVKLTSVCVYETLAYIHIILNWPCFFSSMHLHALLFDRLISVEVAVGGRSTKQGILHQQPSSLSVEYIVRQVTTCLSGTRMQLHATRKQSETQRKPFNIFELDQTLRIVSLLVRDRLATMQPLPLSPIHNKPVKRWLKTLKLDKLCRRNRLKDASARNLHQRLPGPCPRAPLPRPTRSLSGRRQRWRRGQRIQEGHEQQAGGWIGYIIGDCYLFL